MCRHPGGPCGHLPGGASKDHEGIIEIGDICPEEKAQRMNAPHEVLHMVGTQYVMKGGRRRGREGL